MLWYSKWLSNYIPHTYAKVKKLLVLTSQNLLQIDHWMKTNWRNQWGILTRYEAKIKINSAVLFHENIWVNPCSILVSGCTYVLACFRWAIWSNNLRNFADMLAVPWLAPSIHQIALKLWKWCRFVHPSCLI
jgi:hypothetical protein